MITLLILSCKRLHYLRRTLQSIRHHLAMVEPGIRPTIVCFDNGSSPEDRIQLAGMGFDRLLLSGTNLGIGPAMNQLVSAVRTPYLLNLQDDWVVENPHQVPFIGECVRILASDARILQIKLDRYHFLDFSDRNRYDGPFTAAGSNLPFYVQNPKILWGGFSFPPAITRTASLHELGPFREDQPFRRGWAESEYSARSVERFVVAKSPAMTLFKHIGDEPSTGWQKQPAEPQPPIIVPASAPRPSSSPATPDRPRIACLLTAFKRPQHLARQLEALAQQSITPEEIAVWHNYHPDVPIPEALLDSVRHVRSTTTNWGVWPRFPLCQEFASPYVCVFDDDTIPGPRWLENCVRTMTTHEGLLGTIGIRFRDGTRSQQSKVGWCNPQSEVTEVDLVGHAWFFKRDWLRVFSLEPRQGFPTCGEDYHFSVALQKHLGLGTYVPPHDPDNREGWGSIDGDLGTDDAALYLQVGESDKKAMTHRAYIVAGWRPLALRNHSGSSLEDILSAKQPASPLISSALADTVHARGHYSPSTKASTSRPYATFSCTRDFTSDFDLMDFQGPPFAFARFGDGELALCSGRPIRVSDGWTYDGSNSTFSRKMKSAIEADLPGMYLGISCPCCDMKGHEWYVRNMKCPLDRITYANLFVNGNYERFRTKDLRGSVLVSSSGGDFTVPRNAIEPEFDYQPLLQGLFQVDRPILVAAGPLSCLLIHDYWQQAPNRQVIVDIGSALDPIIHGRPTRGYHHADHPNRSKRCVWSRGQTIAAHATG